MHRPTPDVSTNTLSEFGFAHPADHQRQVGLKHKQDKVVQMFRIRISHSVDQNIKPLSIPPS